MLISFRQGLISAPSLTLQASSTPNYINLVVTQKPILVAIADGAVDYLVGVYSSVSNAWGPFTGSSTRFLYVELDGITGALSYGATSLPLQQSASAPVSPAVEQMWWDTTNFKMFVWDGTSWQHVLRAFLGSLVSGVTLTPASPGSQVNLNVPGRPGYVLTDGFDHTFRNNDGSLLTTETPVVSSNTGSLVKIDGAQVVVQANSPLAAFTCVYLVDGRAEVATSVPPDELTKAPIAVVVEDVVQNSPIELVMAGKTVFNENWNFPTSDWGLPVYCDEDGQITTSVPSAPSHVRVGYIINANGIYLTFDSFTNPSQSEDGLLVNADAPLEVEAELNTVTISLPKSTSLVDGYLAKEDFQRILDLEALIADKADVTATWPQSSIVGLTASLANKANVTHTHAIADVTGLQGALDGKLPLSQAIPISQVTSLASQLSIITTNINAKIDKKPTAVVGNFAMFDDPGNVEDSGYSSADFSLVDHVHAISGVTGLQAALDGKAAASHTHNIGDVTGLQGYVDTIALKATKVVGGTTGNFTTLTITGDLQDSTYSAGSFALVSHTHSISAVSGLQTALDGKAALSHTHAIADITNLQTTLDGKAASSHTHTISSTTGLQAALDAKLGTGGGTISGSLTVNSSTVFNANGSISFSGSAGTAGHVLTSNGSGSGPSWQAAGVIPAGGTEGQVLAKVDSTNYNVTWIDQDDSGLSEPIGQIIYGTGASVTSSDRFSFDGVTLTAQALRGTSTGGDPDVLIISSLSGTAALPGGEIRIVAGGNTAGADGGKVVLYGGNSTGEDGGGIEIFSGLGAAAQSSGDILIGTAGGHATDGNSGNIAIATGGANGAGTAGSITLRTGGLDRLAISGVGAWSLAGDPGSDGYVLTSNGAGGPPTWEAATGGTFDFNAIPFGDVSGELITSDLLLFNPNTGSIIVGGLIGAVDEDGEPLDLTLIGTNASVNNPGGAIRLSAGASNTTHNGGEIALIAGDVNGTAGDAGDVLISGGRVGVSVVDNTQSSGNIAITSPAPLGSFGSSGSIEISTGAAAGGGTVGTVTISTGDVNRLKILASGAIEFSGAAGTSGQFLKSNGVGSPPTWVSGGGDITNPFTLEFIDPSIKYRNLGAGTFDTITGEALGSNGSSTFSGTLANGSVRPGYLVIYNDTNTLFDNGDGTLTGDNQGSGTIDYDTGAFALTGIVAETDLTADYDYLLSTNNDQIWRVGVSDLTYAIQSVNDAEDTAIPLLALTREAGNVHANSATFSIHGSSPSFAVNMASGQNFTIDASGIGWGTTSFGVGTQIGNGAFLAAPEGYGTVVQAGAAPSGENPGLNVSIIASSASGSASNGGNVLLTAGSGVGSGLPGRIVIDGTLWGFRKGDSGTTQLALTSSNSFTGTPLTIDDRSSLPSVPLLTWKGVTRLEGNGTSASGLSWRSPSASSDEKNWIMGGDSSGNFTFATSTDGSPFTPAANILVVDRVGGTDLASISYGNNSSAPNHYVYGSQHLRSSPFSVDGDSQQLQVLLKAQTTDATQTELLVNGSKLVVPDNTTWAFEVHVVARRTDAADESIGYRYHGVVDRQSGAATVALVGTVAETADGVDAAASTWDIVVDADASFGTLRIRVTGEATKTIRWVAFAKIVSVSN